MGRYLSEGDPNGLSDCDSLRRQNEMNHDLIRTLREEIRVLREERRWVPVGERLPPDNVAVLCWVDGCGAEMVWRENGQWFLSFAGYPISDSTYTHWQPLPPGPEPKEANRE